MLQSLFASPFKARELRVLCSAVAVRSVESCYILTNQECLNDQNAYGVEKVNGIMGWGIQGRLRVFSPKMLYLKPPSCHFGTRLLPWRLHAMPPSEHSQQHC